VATTELDMVFIDEASQSDVRGLIALARWSSDSFHKRHSSFPPPASRADLPSIGVACRSRPRGAAADRVRNSQEGETMNGNVKTINGLNTTQMVETINAIKAQPALARFQFRNRNQWIDGGENRSAIQSFYGAGREDDSRTKPFVFVNGEPPVLLGNNEGANPVEFLLHALAGCVTTTFILHAAARGIRIESVSTEMEGDIDLRGLLGLDDSVSPGYEQVRIKMDIKADCSDQELDELLAYSRDHSPVCNTVCRPVPVVVERVISVAAG
jgi:uncharacterized OsmC-like protein